MDNKIPESVVLDASLKRPLLVGAAILALFFGGFGGWAATAPLRGAAIAPAIVDSEGHRKTLQHLEGGIVRAIAVKDGDRVEAGDVLVRLDDTAVRAEHDQLLVQWLARKATETRLLAEQSDAAEVAFDDALESMAQHDSGTVRLLEAERQRFVARRTSLADEIAVHRTRIGQLGEQIRGLEAAIRAQDRQLELIADEAGSVADLLAKGLERRPRLLALQRTQADLEGSRAKNGAEIARARQTMAEVQATIIGRSSTRADEVAKDLAEARADLAMLGERLHAALDKVERALITAPVKGTVMDVRVTTLGAVLRAGDPVLDLVPADDRLIIEARVTPTDIDEVHPGLVAQVHLLAYQSRSLPRITGTVLEVSADRLTDPKTDHPYYAARIGLDEQLLHEIAPNVLLTPGMPAEALIVTGERTLLDYLLAPARAVMRRALRET